MKKYSHMGVPGMGPKNRYCSECRYWLRVSEHSSRYLCQAVVARYGRERALEIRPAKACNYFEEPRPCDGISRFLTTSADRPRASRI